MKPRTTLRRALSDANLLGGVLAGESWRAWRVLLIAAKRDALTAELAGVYPGLVNQLVDLLTRIKAGDAEIERLGRRPMAPAAWPGLAVPSASRS
jgi:hypothetical protein